MNKKRWTWNWKTLRNRGTAPFVSRSVYHLYTRKRWPDQVYNGPIRAQVEVTNVCNLRCKTCPQASSEWSHKLVKKMMTVEEFSRVLAELRDVGHILVNGVGEPLLNPHIIDIIGYSGRCGIKTSFYTNGTLLTPDISRDLILQDGLKNVVVSLDTGDKDAFAALRIGADLDRIYENMKAFLAIRREAGRQMPELSVSTTIMAEHIAGIPLLLDALGGMGIRALELKDLHNPKNGLDMKKLMQGGVDKVKAWQETYAARGMDIVYLHAAERNRTITRSCPDPWHMTYINVNGDVNPCCYSVLNPETVFGNIFKQPFRQIWNNPEYVKFREQLRTGMPPCCLECPAHSRMWLRHDDREAVAVYAPEDCVQGSVA